MDLKKLKQFVLHNKDHKFIFVENGEPEIVMMSFAEYERLLSREDEVGYSDLFQAGAPELQKDIPMPSNPEHPPYPRFPAFRQTETVGLPVHLEDIRLEDLPV
jgi:hypothetical protein